MSLKHVLIRTEHRAQGKAVVAQCEGSREEEEEEAGAAEDQVSITDQPIIVR